MNPRTLRPSSLGPRSSPAVVFCAGATVLLLGPGAARVAAQDLGTRCTPESFRSIVGQTPMPGRTVTWMGRPTLRCPDGVRIQADSAVIYQETGRNELIGNVRFTSADRTLLGHLVDYYERDGRLYARGDVHFTDRSRDHDIVGDTLIYLEANQFRTEDELTVYGGRPRTTLPGPESESGEPSAPYQVEGDRLEFLGERYFWAYGNASIERENLQAGADTFAFDQTGDELVLSGSAWMESEATRAEGGRLNVTFVDDRTRSITAVRNGRLVNEEMEMLGDEVVVTFSPDEQPIAIVARAALEAGEPLAEVRTEEMVLYARLIEIDLPDGILSEMRATGEARGETFGDRAAPSNADAPAADAPESEVAPAAEGVPETDFLGGNEIVARFEPIPPEELELPEPVEPIPPEAAEAPEVEPERRYRLTTIEATGNAVTLYRSAPDDWDPADGPVPIALWAISYILADRIVITMIEGEVGYVNAEGTVGGLQLEPARDARATPNGNPREREDS